MLFCVQVISVMRSAVSPVLPELLKHLLASCSELCEESS